MLYAQLNEQNICTGISNLSGKVDEYNYTANTDFNPITGDLTTEEVFVSRMIEIPVYSENYFGLKYNNGSWETVEGA